MIRLVEQTDEEKKAMYMKLPKEDIVEMLIQCNKIINNIGITYNVTYPTVINTINQKYCDCGKQYKSSARVVCDGNCK